MTADLAGPTDAAPPPLVIRWVDPQLPHIWQVGYEVDGAFTPFAAGSSEEALQRLIAKEQATARYTGLVDRRQLRPRRRSTPGSAPPRP